MMTVMMVVVVVAEVAVAVVMIVVCDGDAAIHGDGDDSGGDADNIY